MECWGPHHAACSTGWATEQTTGCAACYLCNCYCPGYEWKSFLHSLCFWHHIIQKSQNLGVFLNGNVLIVTPNSVIHGKQNKEGSIEKLWSLMVRWLQLKLIFAQSEHFSRRLQHTILKLKHQQPYSLALRVAEDRKPTITVQLNLSITVYCMFRM